MVMDKPWSVLDQVYGWTTSVGQQTKSDLILSTTRGIEWMGISCEDFAVQAILILDVFSYFFSI